MGTFTKNGLIGFHCSPVFGNDRIIDEHGYEFDERI